MRQGLKSMLASVVMTFLIAFLVSCATPSGRSPASLRFADRLECGMTMEEVKALAHRRFWPAERWSDPRNRGESEASNIVHGFKAECDAAEFLFVGRPNTGCLLLFENGGLKAYQFSWGVSMKGWESSPFHDVCSGEKYVLFGIHGVHGRDEVLAGAGVWLNGEFLRQLSKSGSLYPGVHIPLGTHHLCIEKPGLISWSTELHYDESSSGFQRITIPADAFQQQEDAPVSKTVAE
jgi:hypothetical protein